MKIVMIRHGETPGNLEKRYVGRTDEGLAPQAVITLKGKAQAVRKLTGIPSVIVTSTMKRCIQTAEILFPDAQTAGILRISKSGLSECDFGKFEYKNYMELSGNAEYQHFIDTFGKEGFPGGETTDAFKVRTIASFCEVLSEIMPENMLTDRKNETIVFVVHGGTIMAVMEAFSEEKRGYYDWQVKNSEGIAGEITETDGMFLIKNAQIVRF